MEQIQVSDVTNQIDTRALWEEVFSEDSQQFVDYYYQNKINKNKVYTIGTPAFCMLHLTPYTAAMRIAKTNSFDLIPTYYIVGVATKEGNRHHGYMSALLVKAMENMYQESIGFTFLMPANPKIYEPFHFSYIYEREQYQWNCNYKKELWELRTMEESDIEKVTVFANVTLQKQMDFYLFRTPEYYATLKKELESQNGEIILLYVKEQLQGIFCVAKEEDVIVQEAVIGNEFKEYLLVENKEYSFPISLLENKKPIIMARIICLEIFLSGLRSTGNMTCTLRVTDELIPANNGLFLWNVSENDSSVIKCSENDVIGPIYDVSVTDLMLFAFGKQKIKGFETITVRENGIINEIV